MNLPASFFQGKKRAKQRPNESKSAAKTPSTIGGTRPPLGSGAGSVIGPGKGPRFALGKGPEWSHLEVNHGPLLWRAHHMAAAGDSPNMVASEKGSESCKVSHGSIRRWSVSNRGSPRSSRRNANHVHDGHLGPHHGHLPGPCTLWSSPRHACQGHLPMAPAPTTTPESPRPH